MSNDFEALSGICTTVLVLSGIKNAKDVYIEVPKKVIIKNC